MSGKAYGWVWDQNDLPQHLKYILLAYADFADHEGRDVFPSIGLVAKMTGLSRRSVQRNTRELEELGYLIEDGDDERGRNRWKLPINRVTPLSPPDVGGMTSTSEGDDAHVTHPPDTHDRKGMTPASPEPPIDPPNEFSNDPPEDSRPKPERPSKDRMNEIRRMAEDTWIEATGRDHPASADKRELGKRWWTPLRKMCDDALWDEDVIRWTIKMTAKRMNGLTFDAPDQTIKTFRSVLADARAGRVTVPNEPRTRSAIRSYLQRRMAQ